MNLQDRYYSSQISGVGKNFIAAVRDENLLEAKEAVEIGLFGKAGEVLADEASLKNIADRIITGDTTGSLEKSTIEENTQQQQMDPMRMIQMLMSMMMMMGQTGKPTRAELPPGLDNRRNFLPSPRTMSVTNTSTPRNMGGQR